MEKKIMILLLLLLIGLVDGLIQDWKFSEEARRQFLIERFGFGAGGRMELELVNVKSSSPIEKGKVGVFMKHFDQLNDLLVHFQEPYSTKHCVFNATGGFHIDFADQRTWKIDSHDLVPGFYYLYYAQCASDDPHVSFHMTATFVNPGPNYLSIGDSPVPTLYMLASLVFFVALIVWIKFLRQHAMQVQQIHRVMTALLLFKFFSLFAESMRFQYMKARGDALTSWTIVFYFFAFVKGTMLFVVILLIGTGWSFVKPYLNQREKKTILLVLVLQVINNIAFVALSEASVGTLAWFNWRDLVHLIDIFCCCTILFPIVWSIRTLRQAADTDGKAHVNLQKLTQFKSFYLIVICYVYFTRIVVYLLAATLPFHYTWIQVLSTEWAAIVFYLSTGYKFRPITNNPYLPVQTVDPLDEFSQEYGLRDQDL